MKQKTDLLNNCESYPEIEILSVVARKDIDILPLTIKSVINTSINPIKQITIICPESDQQICKQALEEFEAAVQIKIINENLVMPELIRNEIKLKFPQRFGWVLQQFLKTRYLLESTESNILLIDADTILLKKILWVNDQGNQILMPSLEFHLPYYKLLKKVLDFDSSPLYTFVTHHMLFQPSKFRKVLLNRGYSEADSFLQSMLEHSEVGETSPLCVEFEPYAQGIMCDYKQFVTLRKFSNLGIQRNSENLRLVSDLIEGRADLPYNSVSLHDYL